MFLKKLFYTGILCFALPCVSRADCIQYYKNEIVRIQKSHDAENSKIAKLEKSKRSVKLAQFVSSAEFTGATTAGGAAITGPVAPVGAFFGLWVGIESSWMLWDRAGLQTRLFNDQVQREETNVQSLADSAQVAIANTRLFQDALMEATLTHQAGQSVHALYNQNRALFEQARVTIPVLTDFLERGNVTNAFCDSAGWVARPADIVAIAQSKGILNQSVTTSRETVNSEQARKSGSVKTEDSSQPSTLVSRNALE